MIDLAQDLAVTKKAEAGTEIKGDSLDTIAHHIGVVILGT